MLTRTWAKSTHSDPNGGNCVEARHTSTGTVQVRDSQNCSSPALSFSSESWQTFTAVIKAASTSDV
jgi:hypothetical protein